MNGTPRLRAGAFPSTPQTNLGSARRSAGRAGAPGSPKLPDIGVLKSQKNAEPQPLIPFSTLDAPSQRFYVVSVYTALFFWRLYDFYNLTVDESESLWLFMKWTAIDGVFLYGLPNFRVPWLEWSATTTTILFCVHALIDGILMFRIPIPLGAGLFALTRVIYDREISISERRVKPADILNNPSLILGRQIIHILPEGSAVLNPDKIPICLDTSKSSSAVTLPLQINQTTPSSVELIRYDLQTVTNETILISGSQIKRLKRDAERRNGHHKPSDPLILQYSVKKPGLYRLGKVIDETKLEVQHRLSEVYVVPCPKASIKSSGSDKCRGELSNVAIQVEGTPPLKIKYNRSVNGDSGDVSYQSIQPDDFLSPLGPQKPFGPLVVHGSEDHTWARARTVIVPLNETLSLDGKWTYSIDTVSDAFGNMVKYTITDDESGNIRSKSPHLEDVFVVHNRPQASIQGSNSQRLVRLATGDFMQLPVKLTVPGHHQSHSSEDSFKYSYKFTEEDSMNNDGGSGKLPTFHEVLVRGSSKPAPVSAPGLYTLQSVSTNFCDGDVLEPKSFRIINPPKPEVNIGSEEIRDKIQRPVGLRVALDFSGTPPFTLYYTIKKQGGSPRAHHERFDGPRGVLELKPDTDGEYTYDFLTLGDDVYPNEPIKKPPKLQQTVKPSVSASFIGETQRSRICIDQTVSFDVRLQGEKPWTLEWEVVHGKNRNLFKKQNITTPRITINTPPLNMGGEWSVALVSVTDSEGCKEALSQSASAMVRHQRPTAGFGALEGKRYLKTLESKRVDIPLRLSGDGPWTVKYRHTDSKGATNENTDHLRRANDVLHVRKSGTYELLEVKDSICPGTVDIPTQDFRVEWIDRPGLDVHDSQYTERRGNKFDRQAVCEGVEDGIEVTLLGRPPFDIKYEEHVRPDSGGRSVRPPRDLQVALHTAQIKLDTAVAGTYEYIFSELGDYNYDHDSGKHHPITIKQRVFPRPAAVFSNPGKVYSFCHSDDSMSSGDASTTIPVTLTGEAPFQVDLEIRPYGKSARAVPLTIPNIRTNSHALQIPHRLLQTGISTITIRRVRDSRGCERVLDQPGTQPAHRVQIAVHEKPTISSTEPDRVHYCVGDRIAYSMTGTAPFDVFYSFQGSTRKAHVDGPTFRRIAESPGNFTITGVADAAGLCKTSTSHTKVIHGMPSVKVSRGRDTYVDIHAGGQAPISFEFGGTPPFEFTYTRSENEDSRRKKGANSKPGQVLETKTMRSDEKELKIYASEEGTYEVVAVADAFCAFARPGAEGFIQGRRKMILES